MAVWRPAGRARAVVLVLHGGAEHGTTPVPPWRLAYLRMVPIARAIHHGGRDDVEVRLLRNRVRGWNAPDLDPVVDARWALERIRAERPGVPVVLVGHSMGGRVALHVAGDPAVLGVCALAPWTPKDEPVEPVTGREVLIMHGVSDRMTSPKGSQQYARSAQAVTERVARFEITGDGHTMLRRPKLWHDLAREFALEAAGLRKAGDPLAAAWDKPPADRLRISI